MSGIIGMIGTTNVIPSVIAGLQSLEYRGYDSAGIAWQLDGTVKSEKNAGKIEGIIASIDPRASSVLALGHLRWATHGAPAAHNAHPHCDPKKRIYVVHNGIIDNYKELKNELIALGAGFDSETDTEVIAHLIANAYSDNLLAAVEKILPRLQGVFSLVVMASDNPRTVVAVHMGSSLIVGSGVGFQIVTSDVVALLPHTKEAIYLEQGQLAVLYADRSEFRCNGSSFTPKKTVIEWSADDAGKAGYDHYMLKEIYEQPKALKTLVDARLQLPESGVPVIHTTERDVPDSVIKKIKRIVLLAHGTAYHAALIGRTLIERIAGIPSVAEHAADFRYRKPILEPDTLYIAITQSGETIDTLSALRMVKENGFPTLGVVNVATSTIAREADYMFPLLSGPEIGIASTKVFTSMIAGLHILAMRFGLVRNVLSVEGMRQNAQDLIRVCGRSHEILLKADEVKKIADQYKDSEHFMFLGRNLGCPLAMEGALKLKETSYIHAEGMSAAEFKHGPLALVDEKMPLLFIAYKNSVYDKIVSNIHEVKARHGRVIAIISQDDTELEQQVDNVIRIHDDCGALNAILCAIPLQLFAYYAAVARGSNVDSPKNLSKSVTVE